MRILGIDPGTGITGWGIVDKDYNLKGLVTIKDIQKMVNIPIPARTLTAACGWRLPLAWATARLSGPRL